MKGYEGVGVHKFYFFLLLFECVNRSLSTRNYGVLFFNCFFFINYCFFSDVLFYLHVQNKDTKTNVCLLVLCCILPCFHPCVSFMLQFPCFI